MLFQRCSERRSQNPDSPRHRLCFAVAPPPSSYVLEKGGDSRPFCVPADAGGVVANGDLTVSHCNTATACDFPFLGPAIFGSGNYEVSCESLVSCFTPGGNQANCINVLGRRDSCSPVFYGLWPFFFLPRVMCSAFLMCNCHAGSKRCPDSLGLVLPPAGCCLLGRN